MRYLLLLISLVVIVFVILMQWKLAEQTITTVSPGTQHNVNQQLDTMQKQTETYNKSVEDAQNAANAALKQSMQ